MSDTSPSGFRRPEHSLEGLFPGGPGRWPEVATRIAVMASQDSDTRRRGPAPFFRRDMVSFGYLPLFVGRPDPYGL